MIGQWEDTDHLRTIWKWLESIQSTKSLLQINGVIKVIGPHKPFDIKSRSDFTPHLGSIIYCDIDSGLGTVARNFCLFVNSFVIFRLDHDIDRFNKKCKLVIREVGKWSIIMNQVYIPTGST